MVIRSVATLLVNVSDWSAAAPAIVEYSPANEQVEIVTRAPVGLMVAAPKLLVLAAHGVGDGVGVGVGVGPATQFGNLKLPIWVLQLKLPVVAMYSWVYQKVQSSTGSTVNAL